jgi:hypothetical protein
VRINKSELAKLEELLMQVHGTVACGIDPIENSELIKRFESDLRAVKSFITGKGEVK